MGIKGTGALHSGGDPDLPPDLRTDRLCLDMKRARCVSRRSGLIIWDRESGRWYGPRDSPHWCGSSPPKSPERSGESPESRSRNESRSPGKR